MGQKEALQLFEQRKVRTVWDEQEEKWYFSIVDVVSVLTDSDYQTARKYWKVLKGRLAKEGNETVTNCYQLKLKASDGKMRLTDVADTEQLFRVIQSVPSPKAEPFKLWMAQVASQRLDQMQDLFGFNAIPFNVTLTPDGRIVRDGLLLRGGEAGYDLFIEVLEEMKARLEE